MGQLSNSQCFSGPGAWEAAASWGLILGRGAAGFKDAVLCQLPPGPKKGGWPFCAAPSDSQGSLVRWAEEALVDWRAWAAVPLERNTSSDLAGPTASTAAFLPAPA